jgi:hypothetical protein
MTQEKIVLSPSPGLVEAAHVLEATVTAFLETRDKTVTSWGKYESETEALKLYYLVVRTCEGISLIARTDMVLLPAAFALARTAFEIGTRILWLLHPSQPFEREVRWLALMREDEDFRRRAAEICVQHGADPSSHETLLRVLAEFRESVAQLLPPGHSQLKAVPTLRGMLADLARDSDYLRYIELSQFSHGTHAATWTYRRNLGIYMEHGEFITAASWTPVLASAWDSLARPGAAILTTLTGSPSIFPSAHLRESAARTIGQLGSPGPA